MNPSIQATICDLPDKSSIHSLLIPIAASADTHLSRVHRSISALIFRTADESDTIDSLRNSISALRTTVADLQIVLSLADGVATLKNTPTTSQTDEQPAF